MAKGLLDRVEGWSSNPDPVATVPISILFDPSLCLSLQDNGFIDTNRVLAPALQ